MLQNDPKVLIGYLENGLIYYIRENSYLANTAAMQLVVKVGSMYEKDDEKGLAHFIEHLSFRGSEHFLDGELHRYLESVGCSFGADHNAYTTFEYTCYQLDLTIENLEVLKNGLLILSDFAGRATLSEEVINIERGVVIEEMHLGERNANHRLNKNIFNLHYQGSDYPKRWPIGELSVLERASSELIRDFYKRWYQPKHMAVIAVGDFDKYEVERMIHEKFSSLENSDCALEYPSFNVDVSADNQVLIQHDPELTDSSVSMMRFLNPCYNVFEDDQSSQIQISLEQQIFRDLFNRRLYTFTKEPVPQYRGASIFKSFITLYHTTLGLWSMCYEERLLEGLQAQFKQLRQIIEYGLTKQELDNEKERITTNIEKELKNLDKIPHQLFVDEYINHYLRGWAFPTLEQGCAIILGELNKITLEGINKRVRLETLEPWLISLSYPSNAQIHVNEEDIFQVIEQVKQQTLSPYKSTQEISKILEPKYPKGEVLSKAKDPLFEMTRYVLSNGMKVIVMPTEFKKDEVVIYGYANGGLNAFEGSDLDSALMAVNYAIESGIGDSSALQILDFLHKKSVHFSYHVGNRTRFISGSCTPKHLEFLFQATHGIFTAIDFDETVWDRVCYDMKEELNHRSNDPENAFCDFVNAINFQDHELMKVIDLDRVDPQRAQEAFELLFTDPSEFTFVIVGNIEVDLIEEQILSYLGSILPVKTHTEFHAVAELFPKETVVKSFYRGYHEACDIVTSFHIPYDLSISRQDLSGHMAVLNSILETRLLERVRRELGAAYSITVSEYSPFFPDVFNNIIEVSVTTNIRKKEQVQSIILEEVERLATGEILHSEIEKCKGITRTFQKKLIQTNQGWEWIIFNQLQDEIFMDETVDYEVNFQKLTPESLKVVAKLIYKDKPYTQLTWEQEG